jgi:hypothetical protein
MQNFNTAVLFKISGFILSQIKFSDNLEEIFLKVRQRRKTADCPRCFKRTHHIHDYQNERKILRCFKNIKEKVGVGYYSLRNYLLKAVSPFIANWSEEETASEGFSLGIDEHHFKNKRYVTTRQLRT